MNQCMGCQANWPTRTLPEQRLLDRTHPPMTVHVIPAGQGYKGEIVACTRKHYETTNKDTDQ